MGLKWIPGLEFSRFSVERGSRRRVCSPHAPSAQGGRRGDEGTWCACRTGEGTLHLAGRGQGLPEEALGGVEREMRTDMRGTHIQLLTGPSVTNTHCRGPCRHTSCRSVRLGQAYLSWSMLKFH